MTTLPQTTHVRLPRPSSAAMQLATPGGGGGLATGGGARPGYAAGVRRGLAGDPRAHLDDPDRDLRDRAGRGVFREHVPGRRTTRGTRRWG